MVSPFRRAFGPAIFLDIGSTIHRNRLFFMEITQNFPDPPNALDNKRYFNDIILL